MLQLFQTFFGKIIPKEQSVPGSISPHSSRSPGIYGTRFMSSITTAMFLIPQLKTKYALFSEIADSDACVISKYTIQGCLLLGISIVSFERSSSSPNSSCLIGFKCTNKDCLRIFPHRSQLLRHKHNKAHRGTDCANMELAKKVYQINDNRADNLQPARIVYRPLSGDVLHPAASLRNDLSAVS